MRFVKRVVVDTSMLVGAALIANSTPRNALLAVLANAELCGSALTLDELERVMMRSKFDRYLDATLRSEFTTLVRNHTRLFPIAEVDEANLPQVCRDPRDNKFLALALGCEADVIISSDDDLQALNPYQGIAILSPAAFLRENN